MTKKKAAVLALAILFLTALSLYQSYNLKKQATAAVEQFLTAVQQGDTAAAMALLDLPGGTELTFLEAFGTDYIAAGRLLGPARLTSPRSAKATISIHIMEEARETQLVLRRTDLGWQIQGFPHIDVIRTAFLKERTAGEGGAYTYALAHSRQGGTFPSDIFFDIDPGAVVDAVTVQGRLAYLQALPAKPLTKLLAVTKDSLEDLKEGLLLLAPDLVLYDAETVDIGPALFQDLIPGLANLTAYTRGEAAAALVLEEPLVLGRIRVLLNTTGFQGTRHDQVTVTSKKAYTLKDYLLDETYPLAAGKTLTLKAGAAGVTALLPDAREIPLSARIHITGSARLEIPSLQRGPAGQLATPAYRGDLEVSWHEGSLLIVNELPLEEYLYSVVPSEMPPYFGLEPLKAQAVAARSYAVTSIYSSRFKDRGAHVDDSVSCQVYNNVPEDDLATRAVTETTGLVGFFGSSIIDARYFSTSSGYTANFHEVWNDPATGEFPGQPVRYLVSQSQLMNMAFDISNEDRIRDFLDRSDLESYDSGSAFFRWQVTMTREELEAVIEANLAERYDAQPDFILTRQGSQYVSREIPAEPLGRLENIRVRERGEGGNIMALEVTGEKGTYLILKEYNIRTLLRPRQYLPGGEAVVIERHNGSQLKNYSLLPSAFIYFQIMRNSSGDMLKVTIRGGGNGHGVGMSQYGAYGMSQRGYNFREILSHYYPKSELWSIYSW